MKQEIKCPHCKNWTLWQGHIDDRCLYCHEFLQPKEFVEQVERRAKNQFQGSFFFFSPKRAKPFPEKHAKGTFVYYLFVVFYYLQLAFFAFVSVLIAIIALLPG